MKKEQSGSEVPFYQKLGGLGVALWLRMSTRFLDRKIAYYDKSVDPFRPEFNEYCIYVFWHEYMTIPVAHWSKSPITMLVSQHRDAEWLTQAGKRLQFNIVRGSTRRGGTEAIRKLRKALKSSGLGITPDGPKGPRRKMAMGPIFLASMLKMPIVPVGFGCDSPWRLNTWDRFAVPKPFSRARILFGPKIHIPRKLNRDQKEVYRTKIEHLVNDLTHTAEHWAEHGYRINGEMRCGRPNDYRLEAGQRELRTHRPCRAAECHAAIHQPILSRGFEFDRNQTNELKFALFHSKLSCCSSNEK